MLAVRYSTLLWPVALQDISIAPPSFFALLYSSPLMWHASRQAAIFLLAQHFAWIPAAVLGTLDLLLADFPTSKIIRVPTRVALVTAWLSELLCKVRGARLITKARNWIQISL